MPDEFLTIQEVSEYLKVSTQTVYNGSTAASSLRFGLVRGGGASASPTWTRSSRPGSQRAASPEQLEPEPAVDEGSITAWATFGAAMAEATAVLEGTDQAELVRALDALSEAARTLADRLR
jgi:hypothetical protein